MYKVIRLSFVLVLGFTACLFADPAITRKISFKQERAFKHEVFKYFRYFRIQTDGVELTFEEIDNLMHVIKKPYDEMPDYEKYAKESPDWAADIGLSCSS